MEGLGEGNMTGRDGRGQQDRAGRTRQYMVGKGGKDRVKGTRGVPR